MKLTVAIQMDHVSTIDIDGDSTFVLGLEAERRGYALWHYTPADLIFRDRKVMARAQPMKLRREKGNHFALGEAEMLDLSRVDVVLLRQDPPFDMSYITTTHVLEHIHPKTLVVNDPASVRNAPEKLFVTHFDNVMPPTLITADARALRAFRDEHKDIILKPLFGNGGAGVFRVRPDDENFASLLEMFSQRSREPLIAQRYLPEVRKGDKRIILIDGKPVGAIDRVPAEGEARSNMHGGGVAVKAGLTKQGINVSSVEITPGAKDYAKQVSTALTDNPEVVYVSTYYPEGAIIAKDLVAEAAKGNTTKCFMGLANQDPAFITAAGVKDAETCVFSGVPSPDAFPGAASYVTDYQAKFGTAPGTWGTFTYDSANVVFAAIKKAGSADSAAIAKQLATTSGFKGITGTITVESGTGDRQNPPVKILKVSGATSFKVVS